MKKSNRVLSVVLLIAMVASSVAFCRADAAAAGYGVSNPRLDVVEKMLNKVFVGAKDAEATVYYDGKPTYRMTWWTTWDCVYFGNYYQKDSNVKEPIKWRVLSVDGNDAYLMADQVLDHRKESTETGDAVSWENSSTRAWLNGEFLETAFTGEEQKAIKETAAGKVDILTIADALNRSYGFPPVYHESRWGCVAFATEYAKSRGCSVQANSDNFGGCSWAVRAADSKSCYISRIDDMGIVEYAYRGDLHYDNGEVEKGTYPFPVANLPVVYSNVQAADKLGSCELDIRPVIHLDLSTQVWKNAGTVKGGSEFPDAPKKNVSAPAKVQKKMTVKNKKKGTAGISWKKIKNAAGYEIQYSVSRKFPKKKTTTIIRKKANVTIKKLKKKTYYLRIRAYKTDGSKKVYGKWSAVKKIKIKK